MPAAAIPVLNNKSMTLLTAHHEWRKALMALPAGIGTEGVRTRRVRRLALEVYHACQTMPRVCHFSIQYASTRKVKNAHVYELLALHVQLHQQRANGIEGGRGAAAWRESLETTIRRPISRQVKLIFRLACMAATGAPVWCSSPCAGVTPSKQQCMQGAGHVDNVEK